VFTEARFWAGGQSGARGSSLCPITRVQRGMEREGGEESERDLYSVRSRAFRERGRGRERERARGRETADQRTQLCTVCVHPGGNPGENLKSISYRCHLFEVAFEWGFTKETINFSLGCLKGGKGRWVVEQRTRLFTVCDRLRVGWLNRGRTLSGPLWAGYRESRRCSRDTYPGLHITKYASIRRW